MTLGFDDFWVTPKVIALPDCHPSGTQKAPGCLACLLCPLATCRKATDVAITRVAAMMACKVVMAVNKL